MEIGRKGGDFEIMSKSNVLLFNFFIFISKKLMK